MDLEEGNEHSWYFPLASRPLLLVLSQIRIDCISTVLLPCLGADPFQPSSGKQHCLGRFITSVFSPQRTVGERGSFSAGQHHLSLKAELIKDILMFLWTFEVMLSVASISRKCLCSGLSAYALMAAHVLLNTCHCLCLVQQHWFSSVLFKFLRQVYQRGIGVMALKGNKKTNPKLLYKYPSKKEWRNHQCSCQTERETRTHKEKKISVP